VTIRIATRGSELALWQARHVAGLLTAQDPSLDIDLVVVRTTGDDRLDAPIWEIGGKGVFVAEIRTAVLDGSADVAVHSAKDLPALPLDGLTLACVPFRADPRDALVGSRLDDLAPGALVATGSVRRRSQLAWARPDLRFTGIRGNIATRLARVGHDGIDAVVVAMAALDRLGLSERAAEVLDPAMMLPQVGQGALAVECGENAPDRLRSLLASAEHPASRTAVDAERGFLAELGGDCDLPAGAMAIVAADGSITLTGVLASLDGHVVLRHSDTMSAPGLAGGLTSGLIEGLTSGLASPDGADPAGLGRAVARHLLDHRGGASLLSGLTS
jgi:hydroxymethylbilane synthase